MRLQALVLFVMCPVILVDPRQIRARLPFGFPPSLGLIFLSVCPFYHEFLSDNRLGNIPPAVKEIKQSIKIKICFNNFSTKDGLSECIIWMIDSCWHFSFPKHTQKKDLLFLIFFFKRVDTLERITFWIPEVC